MGVPQIVDEYSSRYHLISGFLTTIGITEQNDTYTILDTDDGSNTSHIYELQMDTNSPIATVGERKVEFEHLNSKLMGQIASIRYAPNELGKTMEAIYQ